MIKLVVSDIDGTLLPYGAEHFDPRLFDEIHRLREKGILFCPASGRQYASVRQVFAPIADELLFITENGAINYGPGNPGEVLGKTLMDQALAKELTRDILSIPGCGATISCEGHMYVISGGDDALARWLLEVGFDMELISSPDEVQEDIIKVSLFCGDGVKHIDPVISPRWRQHFSAAIAGQVWIDFTVADKGRGVVQICKALGIGLDEVMAFGDNYNDLPMLEVVGTPYLMASADPDLLPLVKNHCENVLDILKTL